jgi:hypothetical protein
MIGVVHLVWAPLGPAPVREFLRSYDAHPAGAEHELVLLLNGAGPDGPAPVPLRAEVLAELEGTTHRLIEPPRALLDLAAYGWAARTLEHAQLCFLNSYATIAAEGWLAHLQRALAQPGVGMVAASGSWESQAEWVRGPLRYWPYQLAGLRSARRDYPRFPNPHLRTSAFMLDRELARALELEGATDKRGAYLLESGHAGIAHGLAQRALRPAVVGRDGVSYDAPQWPASRTFRSGEQENLLIADNRTRDYERASARLRRRLARDSWGAARYAAGGR